MSDGTDPHGLLVVDKPTGPTSHDIVAQARRIYGTRRVGHTGTLDPLATGVLLLLFGEATKLSQLLTSHDKHYLARVKFGYATDTDDCLGKPITSIGPLPVALSQTAIEGAIEMERHRTKQIPPRFSAIKQNGQPLHKQARQGLDFERQERDVTVHQLQVVEVGPDFIELQLHCSKGYYVRALARDLGETIGCPAHLEALRRVQSGRFCLNDAVHWPPGEPVPLTSVVDAVRQTMPCVELTSTGVEFAKTGKALRAEHFMGQLPAPSPRELAWLSGDQVIAIGHWHDADTLRVVRGFNL